MDKEDTSSNVKDRHILIAADGSENAKRAVLYVGDFLGGIPGFRATIVTVIPEPPEDYFAAETERITWTEKNKAEAVKMLDLYRTMLIQAGFKEDKVATVVDIKRCASVADCILDMQQRFRCSTIVMGRRGISKKEEFLFGSTSSKIMHSGKDCAVWVIE